MNHKNLTLKQIQGLAIEIAKQYSLPGTIIGLVGQLGAGKTTFAKAFAASMGVKSLKSPTFIVSHRYQIKSGFLYHMDFYRLESAKDLEAIGLDEILLSKNLVLIEWVDKFSKIAKQCDLIIKFTVKPKDKRDVEIKKRK